MLSSVGIDLSVLAVFTGAVGVGLGFGLQKIVSNLVSGIILLADKSIKPGDVISVGDQFGWVTTMGARYTAVDTRDGREYLIPNEDFVTQRVVNWSYSNNLIRLEVKFGANYSSDPRKVQSAAIAAAASVPRVLKQPAPICHLLAFGSSAIEYRLAFWISDPGAGITAVRSNVMLALWDTLEKRRRRHAEARAAAGDLRARARATATASDPPALPAQPGRARRADPRRIGPSILRTREGRSR